VSLSASVSRARLVRVVLPAQRDSEVWPSSYAVQADEIGLVFGTKKNPWCAVVRGSRSRHVTRYEAGYLVSGTGYSRDGVTFLTDVSAD
jgi:hypothetical protein